MKCHQAGMKDDSVLLLSDLLSFHIFRKLYFCFCHLLFGSAGSYAPWDVCMGVGLSGFLLYPVNVTNYSSEKGEHFFLLHGFFACS